MNQSDCIVAVDVGNSAVKVLVAPADHSADPSGAATTVSGKVRGNQANVSAGPQRVFPLHQRDWAQQLCRWVDSVSDSAPLCWWVATVNRSASDPLQEMVAQQFGSRLKRWHRITHQDVPMVTEVEAPSRLGIDRLVGAFAASRRYPGALVVVDAGSAVTIDWVRRGGDGQAVFAGGAILPGVRMQQAALATGPEGLRRPAGGETVPALEAGGETNAAGHDQVLFPGTNTEQAIRTGVLAAVAGAVDRLALEYPGLSNAECPKQGIDGYEKQNAAFDSRDSAVPLTVISGGDGPLIARLLRSEPVLVPQLVCLGVLEVAALQCESAASGIE